MADTEHEKLVIEPGQTVVYLADEQGRRYRARFEAGDDDAEIEVAIGTP